MRKAPRARAPRRRQAAHPEEEDGRLSRERPRPLRDEPLHGRLARHFAVLGVSFVASDGKNAQSRLQNLVNFIEDYRNAVVVAIDKEILHEN